MAIDNKYGRVTLEKGTIGEDEPVVVFRAQDKVLPQLLEAYKTLCMQVGSPQRHIDLIAEAENKVLDWQQDNVTKIPESANY